MSNTASSKNEGRLEWSGPFGKVRLREFAGLTIEGIRIFQESRIDTRPLVLSSGTDSKGKQVIWVHYSNRGTPICFDTVEQFSEWLFRQLVGAAGLIEFVETGI